MSYLQRVVSEKNKTTYYEVVSSMSDIADLLKGCHRHHWIDLHDTNYTNVCLECGASIDSCWVRYIKYLLRGGK